MVAIAMTLMSLVGTAVALTNEQGTRDESVALASELTMIEEDRINAEIADTESEIIVNSERLAKGLGIAEDNRRRLDELRVKKSSLLAELAQAKRARLTQITETGEGNGSQNPLSRLAGILKINADKFRLAYSIGIMVLLELGALVSTAAAIGTGSRPAPVSAYITTGGVSHIVSRRSGRIAHVRCGGSYAGDIVTEPTAPICAKCHTAIGD